MYPLEERTYSFSKKVLMLCKKIKISNLNKNLINQLLKSSTSIGANYREAMGASSKLDFRNKIHICKKESHETHYWLSLLNETEKEPSDLIKPLIQEAYELTLIFGKIASSMKNRKEKFDTQK